MAKKVYNTEYVEDINNNLIKVYPLKIKYMREFMDSFILVSEEKDQDLALDLVVKCVFIAMQQFAPGLYETKEDVANSFDLKTLYKVLEFAAEIKTGKAEQASDSGEGTTWADIDLPTLEAEAFLTGIWKNFEELEESMSMPELTLLLSTKRDIEYQQKKFDAAMQGVNLDDETGKSDPWEEMKARVFSGGKAKDSTDILYYQGVNANKAGFGIGMGLDYEDFTKK
jgi:hypothetical protein